MSAAVGKVAACQSRTSLFMCLSVYVCACVPCSHRFLKKSRKVKPGDECVSLVVCVSMAITWGRCFTVRIRPPRHPLTSINRTRCPLPSQTTGIAAEIFESLAPVPLNCRCTRTHRAAPSFDGSHVLLIGTMFLFAVRVRTQLVLAFIKKNETNDHVLPVDGRAALPSTRFVDESRKVREDRRKKSRRIDLLVPKWKQTMADQRKKNNNTSLPLCFNISSPTMAGPKINGRQIAPNRAAEASARYKVVQRYTL